MKYNVSVAYEGLSASELNQQQQSALLNLANQYISNMDDGHAEVKLAVPTSAVFTCALISFM